MRIVALSDTHNHHLAIDVPDGDVLVHAGDLTSRGHLLEAAGVAHWLQSLPHRHKVVVAGNHDFCFEKASECRRARSLFAPIHYLQDESLVIEGLTFYGSPWQPWFHDWAFNLQRGEALEEKWRSIPKETDVLVTHGPPYGILDQIHDGTSVGCTDLMHRLLEVEPKLHVFGHIHEAYGVEQRGSTVFANASTCTLAYEPLNSPLVFDL